MNINTLLMEDKPTTSSTETGEIQRHMKPIISKWLSQRASGSPVTTRTFIETIVCYVTAPRLDSTSFVNIAAIIPRIEVIYKNQQDIEGLLGDRGKRLLDKVICLSEDVSREENWPIIRMEISFVKDEEVNDWQYVLLRFIFHSTFEAADNYLHEFYHKLDTFAATLNEEDDDILRRMLFFDVGTTI